MSDIPAIRRQLKIKTGATLRLAKETTFYQKEIEDLKKKLDNFIANNAEEWDIKNTKRMIEESDKIILDTNQRLETAAAELKVVVLQAKKEPTLEGAEELLKAEEALEKA